MSFGRCRKRRTPEWARTLLESVERLNEKIGILIMATSEGQAQIDADVNAIEAGLASFESQNSQGFATLSAAIAKLVSGQTPPTPDNLAALDQLVADVQAATSQAGSALASAIQSASPTPASP